MGGNGAAAAAGTLPRPVTASSTCTAALLVEFPRHGPFYNG